MEDLLQGAPPANLKDRWSIVMILWVLQFNHDSPSNFDTHMEPTHKYYCCIYQCLSIGERNRGCAD